MHMRISHHLPVWQSL